MNFFKKICAILISAVILIFTSGCSADYKDAYIYFELENKPSTLDPQLVSTREENVIVRSIFDTLLRYDENGDVVASACSSYEKNGLTYTFKISPDAYWTSGEKLTAYDFEFGFKRALDPDTAAPAAATLGSVASANATDADTFVITLSFDDPDFLNTLTTSITMPCNEKFFNECKGRYGLELETTPACGSYYIRKWPTESKFLIRLAKNLEYKGYFEARNMRVYFTCDERENLEMLTEDDTDFAYVSCEEAEKAAESGLNTSALEDVSYMLFLSPSLSEDIRLAIMKSVKNEQSIYNTYYGSAVSSSIAPKALRASLSDFKTDFPYDIDHAAYLYSEAILNSEDSSLSGITVKCYSDPAALACAKALAAHWQQKLGAFVNLEEAASLSSLEAAYSSDNYSLMIMPLTASFRHSASYLSQFKTKSTDLQSAQNELGEASLCYPLFNQSSYVASASYIENFNKIIENGIPDIALAIKKE